MNVRGRPVLGGIAGFFLFLFLGLDLALFGVVATNSALLTILPIVGIVLGVLFGIWAPLGSREAPPPSPPPAPPATPLDSETV